MKSTVSLAMWLLALALPAQGQERGKLLYDTHCGTCHTEKLHQRDKTVVKSMADLRDQVVRWAPQTRRAFTPDELEDVVQYLNRSHYRLPR